MGSFTYNQQRGRRFEMMNLGIKWGNIYLDNFNILYMKISKFPT